MRSRSSDIDSRLLVGLALAALLTACGKPETPPPTVPPPQAAATAVSAAAPAVQVATIGAAPAAKPQSAAPVATPAPVAREPELATMQLATMTSKMGVAVDLRYQFEGDALSGQPVTLHLAAVPRVAGNSLSVSIKQEPGVEFVQEPLVEQKITASTAYRQQLSVRRLADGPQELRVLVTMEMPIGSAFGYFSVPFAPVAPTGKQGKRRQE